MSARRGLVAGLCALLAGAGSGCAGRLGRGSAHAELVLVGGVVYTLDAARPWAEALAIGDDGRLLAVGSREEVMRHRGPQTRVVELEGQVVLPGFHDTHVHPVTGGIELGQCALAGIATQAALEAALRECAKTQAGRPWLVGGGWELTLFPGGNPSRQWLDAIVPGVPVFLTSADGHSAWLNTEGLRRAGITAATVDPPNGRIERDAAGEPTGTLREDAWELVEPHLPVISAEEHAEGLRRALALAHRFGITGMHEAAADAEVLAAYEQLARGGELTARVIVAQAIEPLEGPEQLEVLAMRRDRVERLGHPRLRATSIKIFADGVIEAGTAALLAPYVGPFAARGTAGEPALEDEALEAMIVAADRRGFDVHVHAIGDRAVRMALDGVEAAIARNAQWDRRHVIAHLELVDPADVPRFRELGVAACFQPQWAFEDPYITELTIPVLGPERSRWLYPIGSVLGSGATVVAGSDWSVSSMDPLEAIETAITRRGVTQPPGPAWIPEEVATLESMIAAYTVNGAWLGRWDEVGTIAVGKRADLAVIEGDLFGLPAHRIDEVEVVTTLVDGQVVFAGEGDRIGGG